MRKRSSFRQKNLPKYFVLDTDGVLTDGQFHYSAAGKVYKVFGADDHEALTLLKPYLDIFIVTADQRGLPITHKRVVDDMELNLHLVPSQNRVKWICDLFDPNLTIYMGDGLFDASVFEAVAYSIAPANASKRTRKKASYVTRSRGAEGAVAEASLHIARKFFRTNLI